MFDRIYIVLLRTGDQIAALPMLHSDAKAGLKTAMLVHRDFSGLLDGISYAKEIVFDGDIADVRGQIKMAEGLSKDVRACRVLADAETMKEIYQRAGYQSAQTDAMDKEMFRLAGKLKEFSEPVVFDRRNPERERELIASYAWGNPTPQRPIVSNRPPSRNTKYILIAADSVSSPFPFRSLLFELVKRRFATQQWRVLDMSRIKAEKFFDLLVWYERALCLVACDTAHLHLAKACPKLPVCALVQDKPSLWHGSAWRPNHISYIRYSDFPKRAVEMLDAIENISIPGSPFVAGVKGHKLVHVFSAYEVNGEFLGAKETWEREYMSGHWISTPIELGAIGRDSKTVLKDTKRYPFLKDVIRLATLRAKDDDVIVLTRDHTCFEVGLSDRLTNDNPWFALRRFREPETFHPACDLFAFTKSWWREHNAEVPDLILGKDRHWPVILLHVLRHHGGKELEHAIYRKAKE